MREVAFPHRAARVAADRRGVARIHAIVDAAKLANRSDPVMLDEIFAVLADVIARSDPYFWDNLVVIGRLPGPVRYA